MTGPKPNREYGRKAREEDTPSAGWARTEGGGNGENPGVGSAGPWEEDTEGAAATLGDIDFDRLVSNTSLNMSAMHFMQRHSVRVR